MSKPPAIVAELGRPETPAETAERKAAASTRHRVNQTAFNLIIAVIASLGIVLFFAVVIVRPDPHSVEEIVVATVAEQAQNASGNTLLVPALPDHWKANAARLGTASEVATWYVGYITPEHQFIALSQGIAANDTWRAEVLDDLDATGSTVIDGVLWQIYDNRAAKDSGNHAYAMSTANADSIIILHGTASDQEFITLSTSLSAEIGAQ